MIIKLSPYRSGNSVALIRSGDALTINGDAFDFSDLPNNAEIIEGAIPTDWIIGPVRRSGGQLQITIRLPHGPNPPQSVAFPADIIDPPDGPIALPTDEAA